MQSTEASVAIYWDFENVHASAMSLAFGKDWFDRWKAKKIPMRETKVLDIAAIMQYASTLGEVVINRAYADWSDFWPYRELLASYSMDCTQLFPIGMNAKNGADIRLSLDIAEDLVAHPHIDIVLLVSGDSDFIAIAQRVRRRHKRIVGLGVERSSNRYWQMACNEFKFYHTIVRQYGGGGERDDEDEVAYVLAEAAPEKKAGARAKAGAKTGAKSRAGRGAKAKANGEAGAKPKAGDAKPSDAKPSDARAADTRPEGADEDGDDDDEVAYVLAETPEDAISGDGIAPDDEDDAQGERRDDPEATAATAEAPAVPKRFTKVSPEKRLLIQAVQSLEGREGKPWIARVKIKPMMLRLDPAFDEAVHGYDNFTEFLEGNDDVVEAKPADNDILVRVKPSRRSRRGRRGGAGRANGQGAEKES